MSVALNGFSSYGLISPQGASNGGLVNSLNRAGSRQDVEVMSPVLTLSGKYSVSLLTVSVPCRYHG